MQMHLRVRLALITSFSVLVLLVLFGASGWIAWRQLRVNTAEIEEAYRRVFRSNLGDSGTADEAFVRRRANELATDVTAYLRQRYGSLDAVPAVEVLRADPGLQKVGLQWTGPNIPPGVELRDADKLRLGYTGLYARDFTIVTHPHAPLLGRNLAALRERVDLYLFWWDLFGRSVLEDQEKAGYYLWTESDGSVLIKYMVCHPIPGTQLVAASVFYPQFEEQDAIVEAAQSVARTLFDIDQAARLQAILLLMGALIIVGVSVVAVVLITGREARRVARDRDRIQRYWSLARIDHLVRSFSHGIRNDLCIIRNRVTAIERGLQELPQLPQVASCKQAAEMILHRADRIRNQVERALSDRGDESKRRRLDAQELVCAVAARELDGDPSEHLIVEVQPEAGDVYVDGIESELAVAFANVILNAKQATENKGRLGISIRNISRDGTRWLSIRFRDSGPGFDRPEKALQLGWTTRSASGGTGTGLSIVERVVLQHDGELSVRNALVEGWGAEVEIALPVVDQSWMARRSAPLDDAGSPPVRGGDRA